MAILLYKHCKGRREAKSLFLSMKFLQSLLLSLLLLLGNICYGQEKHPDVQWFRDAKFGLFIHWGLYSQLGGTYKGKNYYGSGEWIMNRAKISANEYAEIAKQFNPVDFNAEKWAEYAKT